MKIFLLSVLFFFASLLGLGSLVGVGPAYIAAAPSVATGIGAKLLCSARFVSHFPEQQAFDDLVQYSPVLQYLTVDYDVPNRRVHTSLFGLSPTTAYYVEGIGCANAYPNEQRSDLQSQPIPERNELWPAGNTVGAPNNALRSLLQAQLTNDNLEGLNTRALLVVQRGRVLAEAYGQGAAADTPLLGWSMAKSLMSLMIGNLEYRGLLDSHASPVFEQWADDERHDIQLSHLLQMSDGLDFSEEYNPGDDATAMLFTKASASDYALAKPVAHPAGQQFNYSSGTANLLSRVYFDHTGATVQSSYDDYIQHIATPLAFHNAVFETDASGVFVGSSYFYANARDWARIGQLMLNGGTINDQRLVSEEWVTRSTQPNRTDNDQAYGYQWWLNRGNAQLRWPDLPEDSFAAQGNRQQNMLVIPSEDVVIVRLGWTSGRYPLNERFAQILTELE